MHTNSNQSHRAVPEVEVLLDGLLIVVPQERRSIAGIRCYLDRLALEQQRLLHTLKVEDLAGDQAKSSAGSPRSLRVTAETISLEEIPTELVALARTQAAAARATIESLVTRVLIAEGNQGRELWWQAVQDLKDPIVTLSTFSKTAGQNSSGAGNAMKLRRWQLEQLATIIREVDQAATADDPIGFSSVLEQRVLPWLIGLSETLDLLHHTLLAEQQMANAGLS